MIDRVCPYFKDFDEYEGKCQIVDDCCEVEKAKYYFKTCWRYDKPKIAKAIFEIGRSLARLSFIQEKMKRGIKLASNDEDENLKKLRQLYRALNDSEKLLGAEIVKEIKHRLAEGYLKKNEAAFLQELRRDEIPQSLFLTKNEYEALLRSPLSEPEKK